MTASEVSRIPQLTLIIKDESVFTSIEKYTWFFKLYNFTRVCFGQVHTRNGLFLVLLQFSPSGSTRQLARVLIPGLKKIIWVTGVLRKIVVGDWHFDNLWGSHFQRHSLRNKQIFSLPSSKTKRYQNSFIMHFSNKRQM